MSMTYAQLKTNIEDIVENSFTTDQLNLFIQQAEQKIYNAVQFPALRKVDDGPLVQTNKLYTLPTDYLYTYSIAVISNSTYTYLLNKDVNFLREAYPINTSAKYGLPKFYAQYSETQIELAPTPDSNYELEHIYGYYPESIVTASSLPWLGENFDSTLLNGSLVEAARFLKSEPDTLATYDKMYLESLALLKNLGDGKLRSDVYRSGQPRQQVN
jgi:hypothetical protein